MPAPPPPPPPPRPRLQRNTETHLPELESQAGVVLDVEDLEGQRYRLRLTYWTNSPSSGRWVPPAAAGAPAWRSAPHLLARQAWLGLGAPCHYHCCLPACLPASLPALMSTMCLACLPCHRMYILEGTSQLLQHYRLRTGDALVVARTGDGGLLMAGQRKQASRAGATCSRADCINKLGLALTLL